MPHFARGSMSLGWIDGRNIHVDYRWGAGSIDRMQQFAKGGGSAKTPKYY